MSYNKKATAEPQNAEKLNGELQKCLELQEVMKGVNAHWRKTGTCMGAPGITDTRPQSWTRKSEPPHIRGSAALPSYAYKQ
jgi:hypothetical protein